jgi:hypothetical protein
VDLLQGVKFRIHCLPAEKLSPLQENNHTDGRESYGERHQCHDRWNETILDSPIVEKENHAELCMSACGNYFIVGLHTPKVFLTIVADTMICPGICL